MDFCATLAGLVGGCRCCMLAECIWLWSLTARAESHMVLRQSFMPEVAYEKMFDYLSCAALICLFSRIVCLTWY